MLEADRYRELSLLERLGKISDLELQKRISLVVQERQVCVIIPDFFYKEKNIWVVEDAKGIETDVFRIKWKLLQILYPDFEYRLFKRVRKKKR